MALKKTTRTLLKHARGAGGYGKSHELGQMVRKRTSDHIRSRRKALGGQQYRKDLISTKGWGYK